jgi:tripartite-type tricarboxylate transporter receptor subunit TctC
MRAWLATVVACCLVPAAAAQTPLSPTTYPTKPITIIVPASPGGVTDALGRMLAQRFTEAWGQQVIVENRPGAGARLALDSVAHAPPDGYTMLLAPGSPQVQAFLFSTLTFNPATDFAPVSLIGTYPDIIAVGNNSNFKTLQDFIAYAKANPGKINMATVGPGSAQHLYGELFKLMAGVDLVPVHYHGAAPAITDLMGGQVQVMFDVIVSSIEYIRSGKLRALAVTTAQRQDVFPDVPTVGEIIPGFEAGGWQGLVAPADTPVAVIDGLNKEINTALADPQFKARLASLGGQVFSGTPVEFGKFLAAETEKWGKVVRAANLKPE